MLFSRFSFSFLLVFLLATSVPFCLHAQDNTIKTTQTFRAYSVSDSVQEDEKMRALITPYKQQNAQLLARPLARSSIVLSTYPPLFSMSTLACKFLFDEANAFARDLKYPAIDMAFMGNGGLRRTLSAGEISVGDMYEIMPFENTLVIVALSGKELEQLFETFLRGRGNHQPAYGFSLDIRGGKIHEMRVQGKPIESRKIYYVATASYWAHGGDNMDFFKRGIQVDTRRKVRDIFIKHFALMRNVTRDSIPAYPIRIEKTSARPALSATP